MKKTCWNVAFRNRNSKSNDFSVVPNPWWGWAADPFIVEENGEIYIFAEIMNYFTQKGCIGYIKIKNGKPKKWKSVISEWYHLSYPFIWKDEEGFHICAESSRVKKTYRYDCKRFPDKWEKSFIYNEGLKLADTTMLFDNEGQIEKCFSYIISEQGDALISLDIDYKGGYRVLTNDLHVARMAGAFVKEGNEIYRLGQICDKSYGEGIVINRIDCMEPYKETVIRETYCNEFPVKYKYDIITVSLYGSMQSILFITIPSP